MNVSWNGTPGEYLDLTRVLDRHCACEFSFAGVRHRRCSAHDLLENQRALDGLVYGRRLAARLLDEEWLAYGRWAAA